MDGRPGCQGVGEHRLAVARDDQRIGRGERAEVRIVGIARSPLVEAAGSSETGAQRSAGGGARPRAGDYEQGAARGADTIRRLATHPCRRRHIEPMQGRGTANDHRNMRPRR